MANSQRPLLPRRKWSRDRVLRILSKGCHLMAIQLGTGLQRVIIRSDYSRSGAATVQGLLANGHWFNWAFAWVIDCARCASITSENNDNIPLVVSRQLKFVAYSLTC